MVRRDSKSFGALRLWVLIVAAVILPACSTGVRLGYEYADTLLLYTIDGYVGLMPEQEQLVKERSAALVTWHRSTQLRDYAELLEASRRKLAGPVSAADVLEFNQAVNVRLAALGERAAPDLAELALTLTPEQLGRLERKLASDNAKARRELVQVAGKETPDKHLKKYADRADFWFGSVSREQLELIRSALAQRSNNAVWWIEESERRQRELLSVLQRIQSERPGEAVAAAWLRDYFMQLQNPPDAERRRSMQQFRATNAQLVAELINAATPEQKAALSRRLAGFAEDFLALAVSRAGEAPG